MTTTTTTTSSGSGGAGLTESCGSGSPAALAACVEQTRYVTDLTFLAQPRPPGSSHWQAVQDLCAQRFTELGMQVELHDYGSGVNVIGVLPGSSQPSERVLLSAHYDSTDDTCPGADDNATGVAALLESARVLASATFPRTLVVACWDEEEAGLIGSDAYAARAASQAEQILVAFVFEMIGYFSDAPDSQEIPVGFNIVFPDQIAELEARGNRGDFVAIVVDELGHDAANTLASFADSVGLENAVLPLAADQKGSPLFGDLRRSDHASFWDRDYPAMMLTDTSNFRNPHYHCYAGSDAVSDLNHDFSTRIVQSTVAAAADALGLGG